MKIIYHLFEVSNLNILLNIKQLFLSLKSLRKHNKEIEVILYTNYSFNKDHKEILTLLEIQIIHIDLLSLVQERILRDYPPLTKWLTKKPAPPYLIVDTDTYFYSDPDLLYSKYNESDIYARESAYIVDIIKDQKRSFIEKNKCPNIFFSNTGVVLVNSTLLNSKDFKQLFLKHCIQFKEEISNGDLSNFVFSRVWILEEVAFDLTLEQLNIKISLFNHLDILQGKETLKKKPRYISHYFSANTKEFRALLKEP